VGRKDASKLFAHATTTPLGSAPPVNLLLDTHTVDRSVSEPHLDISKRDGNSPHERIYIPSIWLQVAMVSILTMHLKSASRRNNAPVHFPFDLAAYDLTAAAAARCITAPMYVQVEEKSNSRYACSLVRDSTTHNNLPLKEYHWGACKAMQSHAICGSVINSSLSTEQAAAYAQHRKHHCSVKIFQVTRLQAESYHQAALAQHWLMTAALCHPLLWRLEFLFSQHGEARLQYILVMSQPNVTA